MIYTRCTLFPLSILLAIASVLASDARSETPLKGKVLFLGDSITYAGEYIDQLETSWRRKHPDQTVDMLNLGLPSETVSGLSEPGHAGGAFPRPDLHERLSRVLDQVHPNVVVACYGMNDGIYHPLSDDRFKAFQNGIRKLITEVERRNAKIILLTPAYFDSLPIKERLLPSGLETYPQPYAGYDDVLGAYSEWLLSLQSARIAVIDVHKAMKEAVFAKRHSAPDFTFASDGVHPNSDGHRVIAETIAKHWGMEIRPEMMEEDHTRKKLFSLVSERQKILKHSWLSATNHTRPGIEEGLPLDQANRRASEIEAKISELLSK